MLKLSENLNGSMHKEKEFRLNLKYLPIECRKLDPTIIRQGVLKEVKAEKDVIVYARIRSKQKPGQQPKYSLGVKNFKKNEEAEAEISKETFDIFYPKNLARPEEKRRYILKSGWNIDHKEDGNIVAEYEYDKKSEVPSKPKHWVEIEKKAFYNELKKLSEAIGVYKCPECGFTPSVSESDQTSHCIKCGASMCNGPGYETRVSN